MKNPSARHDGDNTGADGETNSSSAGFGGTLPLGNRPALIIIDPAQAYTEPSSPLFAGVGAAVDAMIALRERASRAGIPIVFTRVHYADDRGVLGGRFYQKVPSLRCFVEGDPLGDFISGLEPGDGDVVVTKHYPSAFFGTDLAAALHVRGIDTLLITGLSTSGCVRASTIDAMQHGFIPVVVRDAVGDPNPDAHRSNLRDIATKCGEVRSLDEVYRYLDGLA